MSIPLCIARCSALIESTARELARCTDDHRLPEGSTIKRVGIAAFLAVLSASALADERMLEGADADGDGAIARDEFLAARAAAFAKADRNSDGVIDETERRERKEKAEAQGDRLRQRVDANADGKISKDEFVNSGAPLFDRADTDGNGSLDRKEVEAMKERMRDMRKRRQEITAQ